MGLALFALTITSALYSFTTKTVDRVSFEEAIPAEWSFSTPAEAAAIRASAPCSPRAVIGNDVGLKNCVRNAFEPGCDLSVNATIVGTCATGDVNVNLVLTKICAGVSTDVVSIDLCGCDLQSWTCL